MKVLGAAGARSRCMRIAPILRALCACSSFEVRFVKTGQHFDAGLFQVFFDDQDMARPDVDLGVGSVLRRFEPVLKGEQPQVVLVAGEIYSALACALLASKFQLAKAFTCRWSRRPRPVVVRVEAGARSFDAEIEGATTGPRPSGCRPDLWDGTTADSIVDLLQEVLQV